jgi:hypothetical protein
MAVYVYKFEGQRPKLFTQAYPSPWHGLTADTVDELHSFAGLLGLSPDSSIDHSGRTVWRPRWSDITNSLQASVTVQSRMEPRPSQRVSTRGCSAGKQLHSVSN